MQETNNEYVIYLSESIDKRFYRILIPCLYETPSFGREFEQSENKKYRQA